MKLDYNKIFDLQKEWSQSKSIPKQQTFELIDLSNVFIKRVRDNNDETDGVILSYPKDCLNYDAFMEFASVMGAYVEVEDNCSAKMSDWLFNLKKG